MPEGQLPPAIVAAPDGSLKGVSGYMSPGSFWINSPVGGRFEDYLMRDVWDFLFEHYPIRPEREPTPSPACRWAAAVPSTRPSNTPTASAQWWPSSRR